MSIHIKDFVFQISQYHDELCFHSIHQVFYFLLKFLHVWDLYIKWQRIYWPRVNPASHAKLVGVV